MDTTGKDAPTTEEIAEIVELEQIVRLKNDKDVPRTRPKDDSDEH
jgi:hypothetical protein